MKKILFVLAITSLGFSLTLGQKNPVPKQVDVTAKAVARGRTVMTTKRNDSVSEKKSRVKIGKLQVNEEPVKDLTGKEAERIKGDIQITKHIDKASPKLYEALSKGTHSHN